MKKAKDLFAQYLLLSSYERRQFEIMMDEKDLQDRRRNFQEARDEYFAKQKKKK